LQSFFLAAEQFLKNRQLLQAFTTNGSDTSWRPALFMFFCDASLFSPSACSKSCVPGISGLFAKYQER
jgi:hypothetical protein